MFPGLAFWSGVTLPAAPTLVGTDATFTNSTGGTSTTFTGTYTSTTGKVIVLASGRVQATGLTSIGFTIGGTSVTVRTSQYGDTTQAIGDMWTWIGTATGVTTGTGQSVVCTSDKSTNRHVVMLQDISSGWGGLVGGAASVSVIHASQDQTTVSVSDTATQSSRLWVGIGSFLFASSTPMTANSGWTKIDEATVSSGVGTSNAASFWSATGPSSGTQTLTVTSPSSNFVTAASVLELQ
jgi:hypothetical protein